MHCESKRFDQHAFKFDLWLKQRGKMCFKCPHEHKCTKLQLCTLGNEGITKQWIVVEALSTGGGRKGDDLVMHDPQICLDWVKPPYTGQDMPMIFAGVGGKDLSKTSKPGPGPVKNAREGTRSVADKKFVRSNPRNSDDGYRDGRQQGCTASGASKSQAS